MRAPTILAVGLVLIGILAAPAAAGGPGGRPVRLAIPDFSLDTELQEREPALGKEAARLAISHLERRFEVLGREMTRGALKDEDLTIEDLFVRVDRGVRLGKALGARLLLLGRVSSAGENLVVRVKLVDVEASRASEPPQCVCESTDALKATLAVLLKSAGLLGAPADLPPGRETRTAEVVDAYIARLTDPDAGVRFSAAVELGHVRDSEAPIPALVEVLKNDRDVFVRRAAARSLGELHATAAVPDLVNALADKEVFVAVSANKALLAITRHDFGYRQGLSRAEIITLVISGRAWWEKRMEK